MRRAALASIAFAAVLAATGCGGSSGDQSQSAQQQSTQQQQRRLLKAEDLLGIVPTPETPEGANYNIDDHSATFTLTDVRRRATTNADKQLVGQLGKAGLNRIYQRTFLGALNQADASVYLFRSPAGAASAFRRLRTSLQKPGTIDQKVTDVGANGLGSEAWAAHLTGGGQDAVLFLWRNGNVVVVSDMQCDDKCEFDAVKAVHDYSAAIDDLVNQAAAS